MKAPALPCPAPAPALRPSGRPAADYELIARAIELIRSEAAPARTLDGLAGSLGLSALCLQRLFTRWAGISPKRFQQAVRLEAAKASLRSEADVLQASLDAGLSGPGRLHDLFVTLDSITPGQFKSRGAGLSLRFGWVATPLGGALVGFCDRGLCTLEFADSQADMRRVLDRFEADWARARRTPAGAEELAEWSARIFRWPAPGGPGSCARRTTISLLVKGTPFQVRVWQALLAVPRGTTTTYASLAAALDEPSAVRAVAGAVAANRVGYLIPCHRVLRTGGALGGYRWGLERKRAALIFEEAQADPGPHGDSGSI